MSQLDEAKETLNTLRVAMSVAFAILLFIVGAIVKRYDTDKVDQIFWVESGFVFAVLISIFLIIRKIIKKTKEIREL